jgi:hypothetical protein
MLERISIELTNACQKACSFCYNHSRPDGKTAWAVEDVALFVLDCASHGVRAVSFGGGEPLQYAGIFELLRRLDGKIFRSLTTHGLLLNDVMLQRLRDARPDKVHVSIHFPQVLTEVERVQQQVAELEAAGIRSGVNLLVARSNLLAAGAAAARLRHAGIGNDRIVYLPMRGSDTPTPDEMGIVAGSRHFQSMSCLMGCASSPRFCSIGWDRSVAWCSYTQARGQLKEPTYTALLQAMNGLGLIYCGDSEPAATRSA